MTLSELFSGIATAIRSKTGSSDKIKPVNFASQISSIIKSTGNANENEVISGRTFSNANGNSKTGTLTNYGSEPTAGRIGQYNGDLYLYVPDIAGGEQNRGVVQRSMHTALSNLGDALAGYVLAGKIFTSSAGLCVKGTMVDRGQAQYGGSIGIAGDYCYINQLPEGWYHANGADWAPEARISKTKLGSASAWQVLSDATFSSQNGVGVTGGMTNRGAWGSTINPGGSVTIPAGYHDGSGKVTANNGQNPTIVYDKYAYGKDTILSYTFTSAGYYRVTAFVATGDTNGRMQRFYCNASIQSYSGSVWSDVAQLGENWYGGLRLGNACGTLNWIGTVYAVSGQQVIARTTEEEGLVHLHVEKLAY